MTAVDVRIQYLFHSGFSVETANNLLIFDYYRGEIQLGSKNIYVFSSHSHADHFNPAILEWQKKKPDIQYILSSDIEVQQSAGQITFLSPEQETQIKDLKIKAFGSTDLGVSFLVGCEGINIFHAGDLNWWYWWEDSPEGIAQAEKDFKDEIAKIKGTAIDIAFFPVDPRLEHNYGLGAEYFIDQVKPSFLIPMHFGKNYQAAQKFAEDMKNRQTKIVPLTQRGQELILP